MLATGLPSIYENMYMFPYYVIGPIDFYLSCHRMIRYRPIYNLPTLQIDYWIEYALQSCLLFVLFWCLRPKIGSALLISYIKNNMIHIIGECFSLIFQAILDLKF